MSGTIPYAKWFVNGKTNITYNCLDRHVLGERRNKVALIWKGETDDEERVFTYRQLLPGSEPVCKRA